MSLIQREPLLRPAPADGPLDSSIGVPVNSWSDRVVLLDGRGVPCGTAIKSEIHHQDTPLHLAFSCHVVGADGRMLLTRRAATKAMWPATWTNGCCGHPRPGEQLTDAVRRHLRDELGVAPTAIRLALPEFTYRATMDNGCVEHELCPVFVASIDTDITPNPLEVDDHEWIGWRALVDRAVEAPESLSPWSVQQIDRLTDVLDDPRQWVVAPASPPRGHRAQVLDGRPSQGATDVSVSSVSTDPFAPIADAVDRVITEFVADRERSVGDIDPLVLELSGQVRQLIDAGGKRLRPAFVFWGHQCAGGAGSDDVYRAAAAVEMLHTFALLHDDVMDRSPMRRGAPSAHAQLAALHSRSAGVRECEQHEVDGSAWFGSAAAIVAGDLAFVWADELLDSIEADIAAVRRVRRAFTQLRTEVIAGQYLDIRLAGGAATPRQAANIALLKSGRYTVTRPLEIGAALQGADEATLFALRSFGDAAGTAFQLRDDVLGVFGDPDTTGKSIDDDLRDGKPSLLLVRARELAHGAGRDLLDASLGDRTLDPERAAQCREVIAASGALASIESLIDAHVETAEHAVRSMPCTGREALTGLVRMLTDRAA